MSTNELTEHISAGLGIVWLMYCAFNATEWLFS